MVKNYHRFQETESLLLVDQFLKDPNDWEKHFRRAAVSLVLSIIYGRPPLLDSKDPDIIRVNQFTERALSAMLPGEFLSHTRATAPHAIRRAKRRACKHPRQLIRGILTYISTGAFLVEFFTLMEYLPRWAAPWRTWAEGHFREDSQLFEKLFENVKERVVSPAAFNFSETLLNCGEQDTGDETSSVMATLIQDQERLGLSSREAAWVAASL